MEIISKIWDLVTNIVPVERWINAIGNMLKFLSLAFILLLILAVTILVKSWGFTQGQRLGLILVVFGLMALALIFGVVLALRPGELLYSPYERSLRRGTGYGNEQIPRPKAEI